MKKMILSILLCLAAVSIYVQTKAGDNDANKNKVLVSHANALKIRKEKLTADPALSMKEPYAKYKVTGFEISYLPKGGPVQGPFIIKGDRFDVNQMSAILPKVKSGDKFYFDGIKAKSSAASETELTGMVAAIVVE